MFNLMIRIVTLLMLLGIMIGYTLAQYKDGDPPDNLLDMPIVDEHMIWDVTDIYWLDDETLLIEPTRSDFSGTPKAYIYHVDTGEIEDFDVSPLYLEPTRKELDYYDIRHDPRETYQVYVSPYYDPDTPYRDMIFVSNLRVESGFGNYLLMAGNHLDSTQEVRARYLPIDTVIDNMRVVWSAGESFAVVLHGSPVIIDEGLYFIDLENDYNSAQIGWLAGSVDVKLYALSREGHRVIYSQLSQSGPLIDLVLWERTETIGEGFSETRVTETIIPANTDEYYSYAGANFVPDNLDEIVAIHVDGLIQINVETNERTLINPDLNADWIEIGFFSPDNRYVALVYQAQVYVVETGVSW